MRSDRAPSIRAWVPEGEIEYVRDQTKSVSVRFDEVPWTQLNSSHIEREVPNRRARFRRRRFRRTTEGPSALEPYGQGQRTVILEDIFEVDVSVPKELTVERWGQRTWIRFDHGASPVVGATLSRSATIVPRAISCLRSSLSLDVVAPRVRARRQVHTEHPAVELAGNLDCGASFRSLRQAGALAGRCASDLRPRGSRNR